MNRRTYHADKRLSPPQAMARTGVWRLLLWATLLAGCASSGSAGSGAAGPVEKALEWVGLRKPEAAERVRSAREAANSLPLARRVTLRIHAGDVLNTDAQGRSLAVVARVYRLRTASAFQQLPYEAFAAATPGRDSALSQDVVSMREVVLAPGQRHETIETLPPDVTHLAVVALFRTPAPQRWRFVFDGSTAAETGVTVGLHACAISVGTGDALNAPAELRRVAGVRCG